MKPGIKLYKDDFLNQAMTGSGSSGTEPYFHMVTPFNLESGQCTDGSTGLNPYGAYKLDYTDYKNYKWYSTESASSYTNKSNSSTAMFSRTTLEPGVYCIAPTTAGEIQTGSAVIRISINGINSDYISTYTANTGVATSFPVYETLTITTVDTRVTGNNTIFEVSNIGFSLYRIGEAPEIEYTGEYWNQLAPALNTTNWTATSGTISDGIWTTEGSGTLKLNDITDFQPYVSSRETFYIVFKAKSDTVTSFRVGSSIRDDWQISTQTNSISSDWAPYCLEMYLDSSIFTPVYVFLSCSTAGVQIKDIAIVNATNCYCANYIPTTAPLEIKKHVYEDGYSAYCADSWKVNGTRHNYGDTLLGNKSKPMITRLSKYSVEKNRALFIQNLPSTGYNGSIAIASFNTSGTLLSTGLEYHPVFFPKREIGYIAIAYHVDPTRSATPSDIVNNITIGYNFATVASYADNTIQLNRLISLSSAAFYLLYNVTQDDIYVTTSIGTITTSATLCSSLNGTTPATGDVLQALDFYQPSTTGNTLSFYNDYLVSATSIGDTLMFKLSPYKSVVTAVDTTNYTITITDSITSGPVYMDTVNATYLTT